nr:DinB family protein [Nocardioides flavescens]
MWRSLSAGHRSLIVKLDGLDEYDARRPMTQTGTNLLGLVKHVATWESRYLGFVMGRPFQGPPVPVWDDESARGADLVVGPNESRADVLALVESVSASSRQTIDALPLDAAGLVPWWDPSEVTLFDVLVHLVRETERHAGHADIIREQIDGRIGPMGGVRVSDDREIWAERRAEVERAARTAG